MHQVRDFQFESRPEGARLHTQAHGHGQVQVDAAEVYALIHAIVVTDQQQTQQRTSKQFSATRAMLTGGLIMARKQDTVSRVTDSEAEERVYLVRGLNGQPNLRDPLLFAQHQLRYSGLGDDIGHSSLESFAALSRRLREFAPHAFHDDRLRTNRRKSSFVGASQDHREGGKIKTATVTSSNASSTDLAVHLILIAHTRGQL
ncbi:MAG: hypothetical protein HC927_04055 [Deltaproteobacteria bacterium]|nr:hypothetical protein [Deltaproteobacteria bacterium]